MENVIAWIDNIVAPKYLWILELGLIFLLVLFLNQLSKIMLNKLEIKAQKTKNTWDDAFIYACRIPIRLLGWLIGLNLVVSLADGALPTRNSTFRIMKQASFTHFFIDIL